MVQKVDAAPLHAVCIDAYQLRTEVNMDFLGFIKSFISSQLKSSPRLNRNLYVQETI